MTPIPTTPDPMYSLGQLLAATVFFFGAVMTLLVAVERPLLVGALVTTVLVTAAGTTAALDYRRRLGRTRRVCVPKTGICVDA